MSKENPTSKAKRISNLEVERLNSCSCLFDVLRLDLQLPHTPLEPTPLSEYDREMVVRAKAISSDRMDTCFRGIRAIGQMLIDGAGNAYDEEKIFNIGSTLDFLGEMGNALGVINSNASYRLKLADRWQATSNDTA